MYEQPRTLPAHRRPAVRAHNSSSPQLQGGPPSGVGAQLTGHLVALRAATAALRTAVQEPERRDALDAALRQIGERIGALSPTAAGAAGPGSVSTGTLAELHAQAHALAGRLLVVAAARQDTATAMLACRRMEAHAAALSELSADQARPA